MNGNLPKLENSLDKLAHIADMSSQQLPEQNQSQFSSPSIHSSNNNESESSQSASARAKAKRMACVECRQQKSKCDAHERAPLPCTRCSKRKLKCDLKSDYKRTYKRARIAQIEKEFNELRRTLTSAGAVDLLRTPLLSSVSTPVQSSSPLSISLNPSQDHTTPEANSLNSFHQEANFGFLNLTSNQSYTSRSQQPGTNLPKLRQPYNRNQPNGLITNPSTISSTIKESNSALTDLFTRPSPRDSDTKQESFVSVDANTTKTVTIPEKSLICEPKNINGINLSSEQIRSFFLEYLNFYHPILPVVDVSKGPERIYKLCPALFWVIMFVSLRRFDEERELLIELGPTIKNILSEITISPITRYNPTEMDQPILNVSSVYSVQAFLLYTFWPPITSSLSADSSWNTIGVALFQAIRIGLHSAGHSSDFNPGKIDPKQLPLLREHVKTWIGCNIVSQIIATSFGFPAFVQFDSSSLSACRPGSEIQIPCNLRIMMEIAYFEDQVAKTLNANSTDSYGLIDVAERLPLIHILSTQLDEIEIKYTTNNILDDFRRFQLLAARVHLLTYYFLDTSRITSFELQKGLVKVFNAASALIKHATISQNRDKTFVKYLPGVYILNIWQAAVIVGKLSHTALKAVVDIVSGKQLYESAVNLAAKASILKHDMAYRSSGIMKNMWHLFRTLDQKNMSSYGITIRTRMAASVFFDCLFILREQVGMIKLFNNNENAIEDDDDGDDQESQSYEEDEGESDEETALVSDDPASSTSIHSTSINTKTSDSKGENTSTPGSIKSNNSTKSKKSRSLSDAINPESSARKIIRTIPLDPQPISVAKNDKPFFKSMHISNITHETSNKELPHENGKDIESQKKTIRREKSLFSKGVKPKKTKSNLSIQDSGNNSSVPTPPPVQFQNQTSLFSNVHTTNQYHSKLMHSPHIVVGTPHSTTKEVPTENFNYKDLLPSESPINGGGLEVFELDNWEINGDLLWKDVDSVMNDFGFHPS